MFPVCRLWSVNPKIGPSSLNMNTSGQPYPSHQASGGFPAPQNNPNPPSSYYPNARARANTINQMDSVPPALARLQHMNQDVISGRNALTPVLKRDDAIREWERRQTGKVAAAQPYPQLEYLQQQAELAAAQGLTNWGSSSRYAGSGTAPQHSSNLAHSFHVQPATTAMVVDDDRRDVVMSSVRSAAQSDGPGTVFGASSNAVTNTSQAFSNTATATSRFPAFSQQQQQSQNFDTIDRRTDIGSLYVPMQPDQFTSYGGQANATTTQPGSARHPSIQPGQTLPPSFYGSGIVPAGSGGTTVGAQQGQRSMFDPSVPQASNNLKDSRRPSNTDIWPR
jgi:dual specificity protein kinase YAK1